MMAGGGRETVRKDAIGSGKFSWGVIHHCKVQILTSIILYANVAEQADARDLKSLGGSTMWVRFPPFAPLFF